MKAAALSVGAGQPGPRLHQMPSFGHPRPSLTPGVPGPGRSAEPLGGGNPRPHILSPGPAGLADSRTFRSGWPATGQEAEGAEIETHSHAAAPLALQGWEAGAGGEGGAGGQRRGCRGSQGKQSRQPRTPCTPRPHPAHLPFPDRNGTASPRGWAGRGPRLCTVAAASPPRPPKRQV